MDTATASAKASLSTGALESPEMIQTGRISPRPIPSHRTSDMVIQLARAVISTQVDGLDSDLELSDSDIDTDIDEGAENVQDGDEFVSEQGHHETGSDGRTQSTPAGMPAAPIVVSAIGNTIRGAAPQHRVVSGKIDSIAPGLTIDSTPKPTEVCQESTQLSSALFTEKITKPAAPSSVKLTAASSVAVDSSQQPASTSESMTATTSTRVGTPLKAKVDPLAPTPTAPYGYKLVKVKKADGTITTVKRPLKEGETPPVPRRVNKDAQIPSTVRYMAEKPTPSALNNTKGIRSAIESPSQPTLSEKAAFDPDTEAQLGKQIKPQSKIQVTEKELEQGEVLQVVDPTQQEAHLKHGHDIATVVKLCAWTVAIVFPLFFLALGLAVIFTRNQMVPGSYFAELGYGIGYDYLSQAITIAASVWPIVFAAVVAQSLKMYAAYKVERGVKLMTLEQLTSTHSVGGALKQPFLLRKFNWTTTLLIFIWALSPLAGQGILRMSTTTSDHNVTDTTALYFSSVTAWNKSKFGTTDWDYSGKDTTIFTSSYQAEYSIIISLMQGYSLGRSSDQDVYQNLKIPLVGTRNISSHNIDWERLPSHYSSLIGFPFWILNRSFPLDGGENPFKTQETNFSMSSRYFNFTCLDPTMMNASSEIIKLRNLTLPDGGLGFSASNNTPGVYCERLPSESTSWENATTSLTNFANETSSATDCVNTTYMYPGSTGVLYFASYSRETSDTDISQNDTILDDSETATLLYSECQYKSVRVDSFVQCVGTDQGPGCHVLHQTEVSESADDAPPLGYYFAAVLQGMTAGVDVSQLERFLNDTDYASKYSHKTIEELYGSLNITGVQLSARLGMAVNALWSLGLGTAPYTAPDYQSWHNHSFASAEVKACGTEPKFYRYTVVWPWVIILIVCSSLLTIAAIAAAIWETRTVGPDFLGFINTSMKKSVKMPRNLSNMNARERLKALQKCDVMLHDAKPNASVGKIALGVKEDGQARLVKTRQYR